MGRRGFCYRRTRPNRIAIPRGAPSASGAAFAGKVSGLWSAHKAADCTLIPLTFY
jgi:hypothetical protein